MFQKRLVDAMKKFGIEVPASLENWVDGRTKGTGTAGSSIFSLMMMHSVTSLTVDEE